MDPNPGSGVFREMDPNPGSGVFRELDPNPGSVFVKVGFGARKNLSSK